MDTFFTKRLLTQLENTDGQDHNFGTRAYDDVFFQPVDGNLRKPYFDMNEISLQFCENGLPRAGGVTLMSGCFYFNNISKLVECRNELYEQVFKTSSFFLSTGLSRTPLSGFPTPDIENLVRFVIGQRSNRQKDSTWVWPPNQKGFGYADPTLTELLNMFSNDEGALEEIFSKHEEFEIKDLEKSVINPFFRKKCYKNLLILYQDKDKIESTSYRDVSAKTISIFGAINAMLDVLNKEFNSEINDNVTSDFTPFALYRDICKIGVSYINAYAHVAANLLNLSEANRANSLEVSKKLQVTINQINTISRYLLSLTNKFAKYEFIECDFFLYSL